MPEESQQSEGARTLEDEIRELERKLEEKKRAYKEAQKEKPEEKEMLREVLREHIERMPKSPSSQIQPHKQTQTKALDDQKKKIDDTASREAEEEVRALIELALTKGIAEAVSHARLKTPYLLDELHDHLVDDYYEKLVQLRKLEQL